MKKLFTPIRIGKLEIPNRVVMPAMHMNYTMGGEVSAQLIDFYDERANGGAGLIIIGGCAIDKAGGSPLFVGLDKERFVPGLKKLTESIHRYESRVFAQLYQAGRYSFSFLTGQSAVAPSPIPSSFTRETPRQLEVDEIRTVVDAFGAAAERAKRTGFDGVEILGSAGYLICQFLSPLTNERADEYGGSYENRMRFPLEVIRAVREAVGESFPVLIRVAGNDFMPGSNTNDEIKTFCRTYEEAGVNAINVTGGWHETKVPQLTYTVPQAGYVYLAHRIKRAVGVPVIASNRINDPDRAEAILLQHQADLVAIGRALIADPMFLRKVAEGREEEIARCIGCNQGCFDAVFQGKPVGCLVNARAGREKELSVEPAPQLRRILVAGAGPAGMEFARVAAMRGHQVQVHEKGGELGGQFSIGCTLREKWDFYSLIEYLATQLDLLDVDVSLFSEVTAELVEREKPDVVVAATGARPRMLDIPISEKAQVVSPLQVLRGEVEVGDSVAIIGGGAVGCDVALHIAREGAIDAETAYFLLDNEAETPETIRELIRDGGRKVTIIEMLDRAGNGIGKTTRWVVFQDMRRRGVEILTETTAQEITEKEVIVETPEGRLGVPADTVILAVGAEPENKLCTSLEGTGYEVIRIGDAQEPRNALEAISESMQAAIKV